MFARSKILGVNGGRLQIQPSSHNYQLAAKAHKVEASLMPDISSGNAINKSVNAFWQSNYQYMMTGIIPATPDLTDSQSLALFYRDMYLHDNVAGSAVDIQSSFPFSDWELRGLDTKELEIYNDSLDRLNLQELLPQISTSYLVDGFFAGSLVFDPKSKQFMDILIHDALNCSIIPSPFHNIDPKITVHNSGMTKMFLDNASEYAEAYLRAMPQEFLNLLTAEAFDLDPVSTLYIARRMLNDRAYTSYLQRLLPCYLVEKVLFRGTLVEAQRRQRATTHIKVGDDQWVPTDDELNAITQIFQATESDPLGAWIATRNNVDVNEFRTAGDIWKWYETSESLTPMKLRALGISDAFLSGDACLTGDTLVTTRDGLKRIDSFGTSDSTEWIDCDVELLSRTGWQRAKAWRYSGQKHVYKITTENGITINATDNHRFWVNDREWVALGYLMKGSVLTLADHTLTRITNIQYVGVFKVYDFSMTEDPSFVANGLIVHNSYASSESAYSTFVETVNSYRNHLTAKIFYNKLFPLIAVVNDLYKQGVQAPKVMNIGQFLFNANNRQALKMPKLHWHKQLEVRDEQSQFDMLEKLAEHDIPVPISTWVAAAGVDVEALIRDLEESAELQKRLDPFKEGAINNDSDGTDLFASAKEMPDDPDDQDSWDHVKMSQVWNKLHKLQGRVPLLSRRYSEADNAEWSVSSDGTRHLKANQQAAKKDRLWKIAKIAAKYNRDKNYRASIIQKNKERGMQYLKGF
jgi:hypothetical protein